ncbi:heparanase-like protein 1 [Cryptomeria japonica]|uniref:heparanase-like protein 1 n=1 Tax=Cryptomeria japonica TaxID=3369 RepID=UPI0025ACBC81|nr:heparanase-like protein 1 [Cryptomeria japonica]
MWVFVQMGLWIWSAVAVIFFQACDGQSVFNPPPMVITVGVVVNGSAKIAETYENFICATLDWWPPEKCDYGRCSWIQSSILNLDLKNPSFAKAIQAFAPLKVRLGGTLQDKLLYDVGNLSQPCHPFMRNTSLMFGFSKGCLTMSRWDEVNRFLAKTGAMVMFGLNALYGRYQITKGHWGGAWDSSNARNLIQYTVDHGYKIYAWEYGNELSGSGIGARVDANVYASDIIELNKILKEIYKHSHEKPLLVAPDGFFDPSWFQAILQETGPNILNAVTRHIYNLGAGVDKNLTTKILNPSHLNKDAIKFRRMQDIVRKYGPWSSSWVGEAGGAFNSGQHLVSDAFINSFWYLDQLGMSATFDTKVYCRQSLIGGNYALLNVTTFEPNPDYYSALLWHRLMGRTVLSNDFTGPTFLRSYAHCAKSDSGITLLLINLNGDTSIDVNVSAYPNITESKKGQTAKESFVHALKKFFSWAGSKTSDVKDYRMEYHLTAKDGDLHGQTMLLNGAILKLTEDGDIPPLNAVMVDATLPISVAPFSIVFVSLPGISVPACS